MWLLEDDSVERDIMTVIFGHRYSMRAFPRLDGFRDALSRGEGCDILVADIRLPDGLFLDFLATSGGRLCVSNMAVLVVTGTFDVDAMRFCFATGVRDYIVKPYHENELFAKVERILAGPQSDSSRPRLPFSLDGVHFVLVRGDRRSPELTAKEFRLLTLLSCAGGSPVRREVIELAVWPDVVVTPKTLNAHLSNLRRKTLVVGADVRFQAPDGYLLVDVESRDEPSRMIQTPSLVITQSVPNLQIDRCAPIQDTDFIRKKRT